MTRKQLSLAALALLLCGGGVYAVDWTIDELRYRALLADRALIAGDRDASVKPERACPDPENTLVFVIFGQSNAANHGGARLTAPDETYDFYDNRCFTGDDPQFSATGKGGSPWPAFAATLREGGETRQILMANVAVGNTAIKEWLPGTQNSNFFDQESRALQAAGYSIDAFLFLQGEADRRTPEATYHDGLTQISDTIRDIAPDAPLILSDTSICELQQVGGEAVPALAMARAALADARSDVFLGPNTDRLGETYRYDGCHFNRAGLEELGRRWAASVSSVLD